MYYGDTLTITATPSSNYKIQTFTVNGTNWTSGNSIEVDTSINIVATAIASASWHSLYSGSNSVAFTYQESTKTFSEVPTIPSGTTKIRVTAEYRKGISTDNVNLVTNYEISVSNGSGTSSNLGTSDNGLSTLYILVSGSKLQAKGKGRTITSSVQVYIKKVEAYY